MDAGIQSQGGESSQSSGTSNDVRGSGKLPSMALDTGIHAGMTTLGQTVYNDERPTCERDKFLKTTRP